MKCEECHINLYQVLTEKQIQYKIHYQKRNPNCNMFCSRSCSTKFNNKNHKTYKRKAKICKTETCNNSPLNQKLYCEKCRDKKNNTVYKQNPTKHELEEKYIKKNHRSSAYGYIRWHARKVVLKEIDKKCSNCGYEKHVEVVHIKPISSFPNNSTINEINDIKNLDILCPNCHWEFDNGLLSTPWRN